MDNTNLGPSARSTPCGHRSRHRALKSKSGDLVFLGVTTDYLDVRSKVVSTLPLLETRVNPSRTRFASEKERLQVRLKVPGVSVRERVAALGGPRSQPREELSNPRPVRPLGVSPRAADDPAMACTPKLPFRASAPLRS